MAAAYIHTCYRILDPEKSIDFYTNEMGLKLVENFGLEPFITRTIAWPECFRGHLVEVRDQGVATDVEEFEENLCCVVAPIEGKSETVEGRWAYPPPASASGEAESLIEMVWSAVDEAVALLLKNRPSLSAGQIIG